MNNNILQALVEALRQELREIVRIEVRSELRNFKPSAQTAGAEAELLNAPAAAEFLAISESSVRRLTQSGELTAIRLGRAVRYNREQLRKFAETRGA